MRRAPRSVWIAVALGGVLIVVLSLLRPASDSIPAAPTASRDEGTLFVDNRVCGDCHPAQAEGHAKTGHAQTFHLTSDSAAARELAGKSFTDPERAYGYHYHYDDQEGLSVTIPELFGEDHFPLKYAFGSGHNAVTFLTLLPTPRGETVGIEHRVSLYPGEEGWELDLTPGHSMALPQFETEHFGKTIQGDKLIQCVSCHTTTGEIVREDLVGLQENVGCQSCHGPGRDHVAAMEGGTVGGYRGFTRQSALSEIQLCGRCHRLPADDPAQKPSPHDTKIVRFQPIGLLQSRCFTESNEGLRCTTCHDPHQPVSRDLSHYVRRCLECHSGAHTTTCPVSPRTDCVRCHMPPVNIHRGIDFHDHWIRVRH